MDKIIRTVVLSWISIISLTLVASASENNMHPQVKFYDANGGLVARTGEPMSTMTTCGACHDTEYIEKHNYHASLGLLEFSHPDSHYQGYEWELTSGFFGAWSPLTYERLSSKADNDVDLGTVDWIKRYGAVHTGGGLAVYSREGVHFMDMQGYFADDVETSVKNPATSKRDAWDWSESGVIEHNCFLCHTDNPANQARIDEIQNGSFKWANTATLANTELVEKSKNGWRWNEDAFNSHGALKDGFINIREPKSENCGLCHEMVPFTDSENIVDEDLSFAHKHMTGEVFSPHQIRESSINIEGRNELSRSWDIHAERRLSCNSCHASINNPAFYTESDRTRPEHLIFEGRKMSINEFLERPSHKLTNMRIRHEIEFSEPDNIVRRCDSCHDPYKSHDFLPYKTRHIWALGCESCHIPEINTPAIQAMDWTVLDSSRKAIKYIRGLDGSDKIAADSLVEGYKPVWLTRTLANKTNLLPYNLVTSLFWVGGDPKTPVKKEVLTMVYFEKGQYKPDILRILDDNDDGELDVRELVLNNNEKVSYIKNQLKNYGIANPELQAEIRPYSIHHGVVGRKGAIKDCLECHGSESRFTQPVQLASFIPEGLTPKLAPASFLKLEGSIDRGTDGSLVFNPKPKARGLYILGRYRIPWIDIIGLIAVLSVIGGVGLHGTLRYIATRRLPESDHHLSREYMYPVYERLWHWLQAGSIIVFIFTGLTIHFADKFPLFSYATAVRVHEIVAFVFIANALLSIAYHMTAGEIKTYLPQPASFIDDSWKQIIFYIRGIFRGEEHPIEKSPRRRLNPLQQVTYLGILYVLIPVQAATGILIWGAQSWPDFIQKLGGLNVIAPMHTLCAWFFAAFLIMHIYLATTGHKPMTNIIAMITGWEDVELKKRAEGEHK